MDRVKTAKPYWQRDGSTLYHGDCLEVLPTLAARSVDAIFADPPYNIGIFEKMDSADYLNWCETWIAEATRVLKPNGAFWVSHSEPDVLVDMSRIIEQYGLGRINWVTWDKYNGAGSWRGYMDGYTVIESLRSFQVMAEYLVYHADEGDWTCQRDGGGEFIFEPLRAYLAGEWKRAGLSKVDANRACGFVPTPGGMASRHYFGRSQWQLPTAEHYESLRQYANEYGCDGEYLCRKYEDLRREYEDLRYTFNNPGKVSSVWQIAPAARIEWHPTPKPLALLRRIVETTTNEGDTVLDPFIGSGVTLLVARELGRDGIGIDVKVEYCRKVRERMEQAIREPRLL